MKRFAALVVLLLLAGCARREYDSDEYRAACTPVKFEAAGEAPECAVWCWVYGKPVMTSVPCTWYEKDVTMKYRSKNHSKRKP